MPDCLASFLRSGLCTLDAFVCATDRAIWRIDRRICGIDSSVCPPDREVWSIYREV
ncbi:MAG: hypothetical protein ABI162_02105 [Luteolibacter sp.]